MTRYQGGVWRLLLKCGQGPCHVSELHEYLHVLTTNTFLVYTYTDVRNKSKSRSIPEKYKKRKRIVGVRTSRVKTNKLEHVPWVIPVGRELEETSDMGSHNMVRLPLITL